MIESYDKGFKDALEAFAYWKDGVQYVGTTKTTLAEAISIRKNLFHYNPPNDLGGCQECSYESCKLIRAVVDSGSNLVAKVMDDNAKGD